MTDDDPIYGVVPVKNALRQKPGPKPGSPQARRGGRKPRMPSEELGTVTKLRSAGQCPGCEKTASSLDLDMVHELLRSARERILEAGAETNGASKAAGVDLLQLCARLDGYCSLRCWKASNE